MRVLDREHIHLLVHQPEYSLFDRGIEDGLTDVLARRGVGTVVFSPLAQGLLTSRYLDGIPADSRASRPQSFLSPESITSDVLKAIRALNDIARARGQTLAQMSLAWILRNPHITSAIIGASRVSQLDENLDALSNLAFTDEELGRIDEITATL